MNKIGQGLKNNDNLYTNKNRYTKIHYITHVLKLISKEIIQNILIMCKNNSASKISLSSMDTYRYFMAENVIIRFNGHSYLHISYMYISICLLTFPQDEAIFALCI